jgi:hypothetical protein
MHSVVFLTRKRCCLCDDALGVVREVGREVPFSLEIVDIDGDPLLRARWGHKIPVVLVDGRIHAKYRVRRDAFMKRLAAPLRDVA